MLEKVNPHSMRDVSGRRRVRQSIVIFGYQHCTWRTYALACKLFPNVVCVRTVFSHWGTNIRALPARLLLGNPHSGEKGWGECRLLQNSWWSPLTSPDRHARSFLIYCMCTHARSVSCRTCKMGSTPRSSAALEALNFDTGAITAMRLCLYCSASPTRGRIGRDTQ